MEAQRTTQLWTDSVMCARELFGAVQNRGFGTGTDPLPRWRGCFKATWNALRQMDEAADAMGSDGMPELRADAEAVRARRKELRSKIDLDTQQIERLIRACEELNTVFRTLNLFQAPNDGTPLSAAPSV